MTSKPVAFLVAYLLSLLRRFERWLTQLAAPNPRQREAMPPTLPEEWPQPPAHWLAHTQPHPPAHWIEHIRSRAPHLLESGFHHYVSPVFDADAHGGAEPGFDDYAGEPPRRTRARSHTHDANSQPQHPGRGTSPLPRPTPVHIYPTRRDRPNRPVSSWVDSSPVNAGQVNAPSESQHGHTRSTLPPVPQRTSGPTVLLQPSTRSRPSARPDLQFINAADTAHGEPEAHPWIRRQKPAVDATGTDPLPLAYHGTRPRPTASPAPDVVSTPRTPIMPTPTRHIVTQPGPPSNVAPNPPRRPHAQSAPTGDRTNEMPLTPSPAPPQSATGKWAPLIEEDDSSVVYRLAHSPIQTGDARHAQRLNHEQRLDHEQRGQTWNEWPS